MKNMLPCEAVTKYLLPALRASIAKNLAKNHKFSQKSIANILGVTQPAVSKYLSDHYEDRIGYIVKNPKIKKTAEEIVGLILDKKISIPETEKLILKSCTQLLRESPDIF